MSPFLFSFLRLVSICYLKSLSQQCCWYLSFIAFKITQLPLVFESYILYFYTFRHCKAVTLQLLKVYLLALMFPDIYRHSYCPLVFHSYTDHQQIHNHNEMQLNIYKSFLNILPGIYSFKTNKPKADSSFTSPNGSFSVSLWLNFIECIFFLFIKHETFRITFDSTVFISISIVSPILVQIISLSTC